MIGHADEATPLQIKTTFDAPFNILTLHPDWELDDQDTNEINFEHREDWLDVEFSIYVGKILKNKKFSLEELYEQIQKAKGKVKKISILKASFPEMKMTFDILGEDPILEDYALINFKGLKCIKAYSKDIFPIVSISSDEKIDEPQWRLYYLFIVNKRLYDFEFDAPASKFSDYEPLFDATMECLF